jgi:nucleotide-binding universal stress UspA family protein
VSAIADRDRSRGRVSPWPDRRRPVVLGTLAARFEPEAERFAFASALDVDASLIVVNVVRFKPYVCTMRLLGPSAATLPDEEDLEPVRATAARAAQLGIPTQLLRVTSSRPVLALLEIVAERDAGLLVFGPDPGRVRRRELRRAVAQVCERAPCLVWTPPGPWARPGCS